MITKQQLRANCDSKNHFKHSFEIPWNETSLSRLYDKLDANIESGALVDIVSVKPVGFIKEREALVVEIVIDCSDIFEEAADLVGED
jgi:hypothetical protein